MCRAVGIQCSDPCGTLALGRPVGHVTPKRQICAQTLPHLTALTEIHTRRSARRQARNRVTVCNQHWSAPARTYPPFGADFGSVPSGELTIHMWLICARTFAAADQAVGSVQDASGGSSAAMRAWAVLLWWPTRAGERAGCTVRASCSRSARCRRLPRWVPRSSPALAEGRLAAPPASAQSPF